MPVIHVGHANVPAGDEDEFKHGGSASSGGGAADTTIRVSHKQGIAELVGDARKIQSRVICRMVPAVDLFAATMDGKADDAEGQKPVAQHWLDELTAARQADAQRMRAIWQRLRVGLAALGVIAPAIWRYFAR